MATQTTVSYESSDDENDEDEDGDTLSDDDLVQPMTSVGEKLLVPLEERKKAFIAHESLAQGTPKVLFSDTVDLTAHQQACKLFGVKIDRPALNDVTMHLKAKDTNTYSFSDWWQAFSKCKSTAQWGVKLTSLVNEDPPDCSTMDDIGRKFL